jgi:hypothetical protein
MRPLSNQVVRATEQSHLAFLCDLGEISAFSAVKSFLPLSCANLGSSLFVIITGCDSVGLPH